jgi:outer membrane lipoprotein-sorting protein
MLSSHVLQNVRRLCAILLFAASSLCADALSDTYARIDKAAVGFKAVTANVKQTVHTAVVNDDTIDSGTLKLRRNKPGDTRILLEFTNPNKKIVAISGDKGEMYLPKANVVQVYDLSSRKNVIEQGLLLGFGATSAELRNAYDITFVGAEKLDGESVGHIHLVPKSKEVQAQIRAADLWISDGLGVPLQQRLLTSSAGDYTQLTYSSVKLNPSLSDGDLKLNAPKSAQIQQVGK